MNYLKYGIEEIEYLKSKDKILGEAIDKIGMIKRPGEEDIFASVIHHIIGQQISTAAQKTIGLRLIDLVHEITPVSMNKISLDQLQGIGISYRKAGYIKNFIRVVNSGELNIDQLWKMTDNQVIEKLSSLKGIGIWTAEMILLFTMRRPDILSFGDLGIIRGMRKLYHMEKITKSDFEQFREIYSPYGSVASLYLWAVSGNAIPELTDPEVKPIKFGVFQSSIGFVKIEEENQKIIRLTILDTKPINMGKPSRIITKAYKQLEEFLEGKRKKFDLPLNPSGTEFQKSVWKELSNIPYGETKSYKDIAIAIGNPNGCRAVGLANNKNPIPIIIPCHRVVGSNGKLVGYAYGLKLKEKLLNIEK
ncbi:MAG: methylated-DNA--[protein]-cysteine S-methyltransferase [Anaerovoracaceae bacterium]